VLVEDEAGLSYRLACGIIATTGMQVFVNEPTDMVIQDLGNSTLFPPEANASGYGIAVDVGTTTVVCRLYDLVSGQALGSASRVNPQVVFGADVMSRIDASIAGKLDSMRELLVATLHDLIVKLCRAARIDIRAISHIGLAGNTVMEHIAAGLPPDSIGTAPFTPLSLFGDEHHLEGLPVPVWFAPCVYGYVGGDITAGLLAVSMDKASQPELLVDLGTNGEIALGDASGILCAATAAGPVFEGAGIHFGMPALPGAIASVKADGGKLLLGVIGDQKKRRPNAGAPDCGVICPESRWGQTAPLGVESPVTSIEPKQIDPETLRDGSTATQKPIGICGSGLIDAVALMLEEGIIDETGRMLDAADLPSRLASHCGEENGVKVFYLTDDRLLYVTQKDVRQLQLAKGAVCGGINTLMEKRGLAPEAIKTLHIAGGFGRALDLRSAAVIGLFPPQLLDRAVSAGNTAIEGVSAAVISAVARKQHEQLTELCSYVELSTDARFNELFIEALGFGA
jgi:uncharacterized 2Fe-2S/4Fe-4S cluster protein (DUF4445 family)